MKTFVSLCFRCVKIATLLLQWFFYIVPSHVWYFLIFKWISVRSDFCPTMYVFRRFMLSCMSWVKFHLIVWWKRVSSWHRSSARHMLWFPFWTEAVVEDKLYLTWKSGAETLDRRTIAQATSYPHLLRLQFVVSWEVNPDVKNFLMNTIFWGNNYLCFLFFHFVCCRYIVFGKRKRCKTNGDRFGSRTQNSKTEHSRA